MLALLLGISMGVCFFGGSVCLCGEGCCMYSVEWKVLLIRYMCCIWVVWE